MYLSNSLLIKKQDVRFHVTIISHSAYVESSNHYSQVRVHIFITIFQMLEIIPNEILLVIFSYLELTDLYRAFSSLNSRFEYLLYHDYSLLYARLPAQITLPLERFSFRINNITLINWHPNDLLSILHSKFLPQLNCLAIQCSNHLYFGQPTNDILHRIVSFPTLSRCTIDLPTTLYINNFQFSTSTCIRNLKLSMITLDMLFFLLIHLPELCSLNVWLNSNGRRFDSQTYDPHYCCLKLRKFSIGLHSDISFEEVLFLLRRMPTLHTWEMYGSVRNQDFLIHNHWENILLGENLFPLLRRINIDLAVRTSMRGSDRRSHCLQFNKPIFHQTHFSTSCDRLWFYLKCSWNR